jgi:hypothetical protein
MAKKAKQLNSWQKQPRVIFSFQPVDYLLKMSWLGDFWPQKVKVTIEFRFFIPRVWNFLFLLNKDGIGHGLTKIPCGDYTHG